MSFNPYNYHNNNDFGSFLNCLFIIDSILIDGSKPEYFVKLNEVNGIDFKGCIFNNLENNHSTTGIYSFNSSFIVDEYCTGQVVPCPAANMIRSEFKNLKYGIYMLGTATTLSARVENCIFENNYTGAYISGILGFKFISNQVTPSPIQTFIDTTSSAGIYLDASTNYTIEDNHFFILTAPIGAISPRIGIVVNNSGSDNNILEGNFFTNLNYGIHAQGKNRSIDGLTGLEIRCNTFENCLSDISVYSLKSSQGIKKYQGDFRDIDNTSATGNLFSNLKTNPDYWSINNRASSIDYLRHKNRILDPNRTDPFKTYNVYEYPSLYYYDSLTSCPKIINEGETKDDLKEMLVINDLIIDTIEQNLIQTLDNGNTQELIEQIEYSYPENAVDLQLELLSSSPYLSDTVIHEAINKENVLNNVMIRDLMVVNSHSAKSEVLLSAIDNRIIPIPDMLYDEIAESVTSMSSKELLESELSVKILKSNEIFRRIISLHHNDSIQFDSVIQTCADLNFLQAKYLKTLYEIHNDNLLEAVSTVNGIPVQIELGNQHIEYNDFSSFIQKIATYGSLDSIPSDEIDFSECQNEQVKAYARNILIKRNEIDYHEPYSFPSSLKADKIRRISSGGITKVEIGNDNLKIYPNPSKDFVIVEYKLPLETDKGLISVFDISGNKKITKLLYSNNSEVILYLNDLKAGNYMIELSDTRSKIQTIKFSIVK